MSAELAAWVDGAWTTVAALAAEVSAELAGAAEAAPGVFETVGAVAGRLPLWPRHLERLAHGARVLRVPGAPPAGLRAVVEEALDRSGLPDGIVRITRTATPRWIVTCRPRVAAELPLRLAVARDTRRVRDDPPAAIKATRRGVYERARAEVGGDGVGAWDDVVVCTDGADGVVAIETLTANLFAELDGDLVTPPVGRGALPGVARSVLFDALGARIREADLPLAALARVPLWVTNAVHGPRPAVLASDVEPRAARTRFTDPLAEAWQAAVARR